MSEIILNNLHHGDALELIKKIKNDSIDFILLDPDYQDWDKLCGMGLIDEAIRVLKTSGNIICFTKQPFDHTLRNVIDPHFRREMVWSFLNGGAWVSNRMPLVSFQKIYWLTKGKDFFIDVRTGLAYKEGTKSMKRLNKVWNGYKKEGKQFDKSEEGTWIRDHYHYNKPHCGKIPAKPYDLIKIFVKCFCPVGGVVLDPFFGSGVTGDVCIELKRNFIAIENDESRVGDYNNKHESSNLAS
jgi:site-specific DNA-methyltransferase (adenine-specific)